MVRRWLVLLAGLMVLLGAAAPAVARPLRPGDIDVPRGFRIEAVVTGLDAPTMTAFDDQGRMLIAESGYLGGGESRVTRVERDGTKTVLAAGDAFGEEQPVTAVAFHEGRVYVVHAGTVSTIEPGGRLRPVVTGLPGQGDHQANQLVFADGFMYLSVGTVTNSAVVGPDNQLFGWFPKANLRQLHDVPCRDVTLTGQSFDSHDVVGGTSNTVRTSPFAPFGTVLPAGATVRGDAKCNGAVLRARPDGSNLEMVAWGLRNPYGLERGPDGALYVTDHGFDARGSRPVENAWDCLQRIEPGGWYGWPDFACGEPVTDPRFRPAGKPQPQFVISNHPTSSPPPGVRFDPHAATNGFAFSPSNRWGPPSTAYVALFGDMTPGTGTVSRPRGVEVVRVDTRTGRVSDFIKNKVHGRASQHSTGGLEHPSDVTFGPDDAMYITDWSVARPSDEGLKVEPASGVVWKVTADGDGAGLPGGTTVLFALIGTVVLAGATVAAGAGRGGRSRKVSQGLLAGAVAGLVMGGFTMVVAALLLDLPWFSPPRVLASMVMGRRALANILEFELVPFLVGVAVLVVLTVVLGAVFAALVRAGQRVRIVLAGLLFGLTGWALLQYFLLPVLFPLVVDKGFPPRWYAASFAVYGLVLGLLLALMPEHGGGRAAYAPAAAAPATGRRRGQLSERERIEQWRQTRGQAR